MKARRKRTSKTNDADQASESPVPFDEALRRLVNAPPQHKSSKPMAHDGVVRDVRVFDRKLTAREISELCGATSAT